MQFYSSLSKNLSGFIQPHILALQIRRWAPGFCVVTAIFPIMELQFGQFVSA